jgi:homocysteine S-methyltransferase
LREVQAMLPQLERICLTDAGLETDLIYNHGLDLPLFASVMLLGSPEGKAALETYFRGFLDLAASKGCGIVLESATWRASPDWAAPLGLSPADLDALNHAAIDLLVRLRSDYAGRIADIVISGCIGPRGDGYDPGRIMSVDEAQSYHAHQTALFVAAGVDLVSAITMTNVPEAIGIARAAQAAAIPVAISFTVETDGRLPSGETLAEAIGAVDAASGGYPAYFMINCAHPSHFSAVLDKNADWTARIGGVRANASRCSHAELDAMTELDRGEPEALAADYRDLRSRFPQMTVLGGCCGTDLAHVAAIADACL